AGQFPQDAQAGRFVHDNVGWNLHDSSIAQDWSRADAAGIVLGGQAVQTVRTAVGVRAVPFARPPAGAWARKPLIARGAASKADGQPDEVDDNEDDEVSKLAKEHDEVQSYDANQVICWVVDPVGITDGEEITQLQGQKYAGSFLLEKSSAADFEAKLKLSDGPKEMLIARIKKLKAAAAIRDAKRKLDHAGASEAREASE
ncbi:unnamed protein product, partial [Symbiodinium sp. KB8]